MSVSTVHVLHGVKTPAQFYSQIEEHTSSPRIASMLGTPSGHYEPLFQGVKGVMPDVTFKTTQLTTLFTELGLYGASMAAGNTDLFFKKVTDLGKREAAATTTHTRLRMSQAYMYWRSLTAGHQAEAKADVRIMTTYDGSNNPLVPAGSLALSGTMTAAEYFCLGPVSINTVAINGIQDCTIDLGVETIEAGSDSDLYNTFCAIRHLTPVITLRGLAAEHWATYGINGTALTGLVLYLRKLNKNVASGLPYVANATAEHIKFTASAGVITLDESSGAGKSELTTTLRIALAAEDDTHDSLTIAVNQAIT